MTNPTILLPVESDEHTQRMDHVNHMLDSCQQRVKELSELRAKEGELARAMANEERLLSQDAFGEALADERAKWTPKAVEMTDYQSRLLPSVNPASLFTRHRVMAGVAGACMLTAVLLAYSPLMAG